MKSIIKTVVALCVISTAALAQGKQKVAVYMSGKNLAGVHSDIVAFTLTDILSESQDFTATERTADFLNTIAQENLYQFSGAVDNSQIAEIGKRSGVNYVCVAELASLSSAFPSFREFLLTARLIDVETAAIEASGSRITALKNDSATLSASRSLAMELVGSFEKRDAASQKERAAIYMAGDGGDGIGKMLQPLIVHAVSQSGKYAVSERTGAFLEVLSQEAQKQYLGEVDDEQLMSLGKQSGVKYVIALKVVSRVVNIRVIDVVSGDILRSKTGQIDAASAKSAELSVAELVADFLGVSASSLFTGLMTKEQQLAEAKRIESEEKREQKEEQRQQRQQQRLEEKEVQQVSKEERRREKKRQQEKKPSGVAWVDDPKARYGVTLGYVAGDGVVSALSVGGAYAYPIVQNIENIFSNPQHLYFAPEVNYWVGGGEDYDWSYNKRTLSFHGVNVPLLLQYALEWNIRDESFNINGSYFIESGATIDWLFDREVSGVSVFNAAFAIGGGIAFDIGGSTFYTSIVRLTFGSAYYSAMIAVRLMF